MREADQLRAWRESSVGRKCAKDLRSQNQGVETATDPTSEGMTYLTTIFPRIMFIPQAKLIVPDFSIFAWMIVLGVVFVSYIAA